METTEEHSARTSLSRSGILSDNTCINMIYKTKATQRILIKTTTKIVCTLLKMTDNQKHLNMTMK